MYSTDLPLCIYRPFNRRLATLLLSQLAKTQDTDVFGSPIAYKPAEQVKAQIEIFGLADVFAETMPLGCVMAGNGVSPPWKSKKLSKLLILYKWHAHFVTGGCR